MTLYSKVHGGPDGSTRLLSLSLGQLHSVSALRSSRFPHKHRGVCYLSSSFPPPLKQPERSLVSLSDLSKSSKLLGTAGRTASVHVTMLLSDGIRCQGVASFGIPLSAPSRLLGLPSKYIKELPSTMPCAHPFCCSSKLPGFRVRVAYWCEDPPPRRVCSSGCR